MPLKLTKNSFGIWQASGTVETRFGAKKLTRRVRRSTEARELKRAEGIAQQIEAETIAALEREWKAERGVDETTFEEAALAYMEAGHDRRFMKKLLHHFRGKRVIEIEPVDIEKAGLALYPDGAETTRRRQVWTPTNAVINFHKGVRPRPREDNARTVWLTPEAFETLIEAATVIRRPNLRLMVQLLVGCGLRTGELLVLDVDDVYADTRQIRVRAEDQGASKSGVARWVTVPERVMPDLREAIEGREGRLFLTPKGEPYVMRNHGGGQIAAAFGKARATAGLSDEITPHVLRHTFATWFYAQTLDQIRLEKEGGWSSPQMVRRYTKLGPADLADRLDAHGWNFRQAAEKRSSAPLRIVKVKE